MKHQITLASWNVFQGLHHRSRRDRWVPNSLLEDLLASLDADVLVLPEAWRFRSIDHDWADEIASNLGYELHEWVSDKPSRPRDVVPWRMVLLTRIGARRLADHVMPRFGTFAQRAIVRVQLEDSGLKVAGAHLYGIHLLARQRSRKNWIAERDEVRRVAADTDVLAGDMNMWGPIVRRDAAPLRSVVTGRTYPAPRPHSQIDHVLVSDRVEVVKSEVLPDMGSDHLGLRVVLRPTNL